MAWVRVILTLGNNRHGDRPEDPLEMSEEYFVLDGDAFHAFAVRRSNGHVSHYVWNSSNQSHTDWQRAISDLVSRIPERVRGFAVSAVLGNVGLRFGGPAGAVAGVIGSRVFPFHILWGKLESAGRHERGYYEVESGARSQAFLTPLRLANITLLE